MKKSKTIISLLCGIVFGLAAFPVSAQEEKSIEVNKRPLEDFGNFLKVKIDKGEIDLDKSFKVVLEGFLTTDGKLDTKKSKFTLSEGDAELIEVVKRGILAISDSGWLQYLRNSGAEKVKIILMQDGETFSAVIESEQKEESKARTMASGISSLISILKSDKKNNAAGKTLLDGLRITNEGNNFVLNFAFSQKELHEILLRNWMKTDDNIQTGE